MQCARARVLQVYAPLMDVDEIIEGNELSSNLYQLIFDSGYVDNVYAKSTKFLEFLPGITFSYGTLSLPLESGLLEKYFVLKNYTF